MSLAAEPSSLSNEAKIGLSAAALIPTNAPSSTTIAAPALALALDSLGAEAVVVDISTEAQQAAQASDKAGPSSSFSSDETGGANSSDTTTADADTNADGSSSAPPEVTDKIWVACNKCDKWRALPGSVEMSSLPDIWTCDMNVYDANHSTCDAPEEQYVQDNAQLRSFAKIASKRLKNVDKAESRLPPSAVTRGRKRTLDVEWIRCCNPACGKWRAISLRGLDSSSMLKRLNRGSRWTHKMEWFCAMNSWDESRASCVAPQEPLWDAQWNL